MRPPLDLLSLPHLRPACEHARLCACAGVQVGLGCAAQVVTEERDALTRHMATLRDSLQAQLLAALPPVCKLLVLFDIPLPLLAPACQTNVMTHQQREAPTWALSVCVHQ